MALRGAFGVGALPTPAGTATRMTVLAIDTCFGACSAAVWSASAGLLAERFELMSKGQSERIVPMIADVLGSAKVDLGDVTRIAVTIGPGSFTGVRTGLAVARGLALATGIEICGTTSLHVLATDVRAVRADHHIAIAVATRDGLVYLQLFRGEPIEPAAQACLATPARAVAMLGADRYLLAGSGASAIIAAGRERGAGHDLLDGPIEVRAATLARLARGLPRLDPPQPLYLRAPDAKPQAGYVPPMPSTRT